MTGRPSRFVPMLCLSSSISSSSRNEQNRQQVEMDEEYADGQHEEEQEFRSEADYIAYLDELDRKK